MLLKDGSNYDMRKLMEESEEEVVAEIDVSMLMRCLETCHLLGISQHVNEETEIYE